MLRDKSYSIHLNQLWFAIILRRQPADSQLAHVKKIKRGSDLGNRGKDVSHTARCVIGENIATAFLAMAATNSDAERLTDKNIH